MDRPFYPERILTIIPELLPFLLVTFRVLLGTVLVGIVLGFIFAKAILSGNKWQRKVSEGIINTFRCTPSIVMLFVIFYGLPNVFWALFSVDINDWPKDFYVITALGLLFSASAAEVMRSSYLAIPKGQREAALSTGLTENQAFFRILLPQAFVISLPNLGNSVIVLLKEGSLAFTIGLIDVMGKGNLLVSLNYGAYAVETYTALAIIYWILTIIFEQFFRLLEKQFSKGRKLLSK